MTNNGDNGTFLVLGGTGKTGSRIVARLEQRGIDVRVGSRSAQPAFDWDDEATWAPALDGVSAVYLSYFPDLAIPGAAEKVGSAARMAAERGIERLVLLSGRGEEEAQETERIVREASPAATIVRCSWFNQNFSEGYLVDSVLAGVLELPASDTPEPFVDADDIADVATAALTEDGHEGKDYELTGPRLLTFADAAAEITEASGRSVQYVPVRMEEFVTAAYGEQVPEDVVWLLRYLFTEVLDGRPARDFADYARETAATGVWEPRR
jgi:uncharacterized protein YbjT (DUF2867 family)